MRSRLGSTVRMTECTHGRKVVRCRCGAPPCPGWRHVGRYRPGGHCDSPDVQAASEQTSL